MASCCAGGGAMFNVEFINIGTTTIIDRKEMEFLFERSDILMLKDNLYTVISTKVHAQNGVVQDASTFVLRLT